VPNVHAPAGALLLLLLLVVELVLLDVTVFELLPPVITTLLLDMAVTVLLPPLITTLLVPVLMLTVPVVVPALVTEVLLDDVPGFDPFVPMLVEWLLLWLVPPPVLGAPLFELADSPPSSPPEKSLKPSTSAQPAAVNAEQVRVQRAILDRRSIQNLPLTESPVPCAAGPRPTVPAPPGCACGAVKKRTAPPASATPAPMNDDVEIVAHVDALPRSDGPSLPAAHDVPPPHAASASLYFELA
jgi:hypothetical protein